MKIGDTVVDRNRGPVYVIAEAGVNHENDLECALKMVEEAARAGASGIKFQMYKAEQLAARQSPAYWDLGSEPTRTQFELFKKYDSFGPEEFSAIERRCRDLGIHFLCTPFDEQAVEFLAPLVPAMKVASADITNYPLLKQVARVGKPVLLSVGASTIGEMEEAVGVLEAAGAPDVALLHCVLSYPTADDDTNLGAITHMRSVFPEHVVGYSDHARPDPCMMKLIAAVVMGARVLEKHFTLDKTLPGNDHYHAMDPADLRKLMDNLRLLERITGSGRKIVLDSERAARLHARRSIVAKTRIARGALITADMLTMKRPGTGIAPKHIAAVVGARALADIAPDTILSWGMVELPSSAPPGQGSPP